MFHHLISFTIVFSRQSIGDFIYLKHREFN